MGTEFKYKLDFYYQQTLMYLITLVLYAGIKGSFMEDQFSLIFHDPILLIMMFFVVLSISILLLNRFRGRKLIIDSEGLLFQHRFGSRRIPVESIEWLRIGRERLVQTAGRFQVIVLKVKGRRKLYRIRVGRYEREHELVAAMEKIAARVPRKEQRRFSMRRRTR
jgi:hypothetical protein